MILTHALLKARLDAFYSRPPIAGWLRCRCTKWFRAEDFRAHLLRARKWRDGKPQGGMR